MENLITYLDTGKLLFQETAGHFLSMKYDGTDYERIGIFRCFPLSDEAEFICVRDRDNKEIGIIRSLDGFEKSTVELLHRYLDIRYFTPRILKVKKIKEQFGFTTWDTETTKGHAEFSVRNDHGSFIHLTGERILISDIDGNRYEIEDVTQLPQKELKKVVFL